MNTITIKAFDRNFNNRNFSIYRFNKPLEYKDWQIFNLELMPYREVDTFKEGLEHIEIVTEDPLDFPK